MIKPTRTKQDDEASNLATIIPKKKKEFWMTDAEPQD